MIENKGIKLYNILTMTIQPDVKTRFSPTITIRFRSKSTSLATRPEAQKRKVDAVAEDALARKERSTPLISLRTNETLDDNNIRDLTGLKGAYSLIANEEGIDDLRRVVTCKMDTVDLTNPRLGTRVHFESTLQVFVVKQDDADKLARKRVEFVNYDVMLEADMKVNAIHKIIAECLYGRQEFNPPYGVVKKTNSNYTTRIGEFIPLKLRIETMLGQKVFQSFNALLSKFKENNFQNDDIPLGDEKETEQFLERLKDLTKIADVYDRLTYNPETSFSWDPAR